ncbi:MAG: hypothetical protein ACRD8Z_04525 [Nitrososphaeraceae archaeon]
MSTNELISQTSSDRSHVEEAIKSLVKAKLIQRTRTPKHKQKKINQLSNQGKELSKIIILTVRYRDAFERFWKSYRKHYLDLGVSKALKFHGWTDREIQSQLGFLKDILTVMHYCLSNFFIILINLKASFSNTASFIQAIIDNVITTFISFISKQISLAQHNRTSSDCDALTFHLVLPILNSISSNRINIDLLEHKYIGKKTKDLLVSLLNLIVVPQGEKNLTSYVDRYFTRYPECRNIAPRNDEIKKYDDIMET